MCSPTRAALLTGRNHTVSATARSPRLANDFDGFSGIDPQVLGDRRRGAEELRLQHRCLGQVAQHARGADHEQGPFDYWPTGYGFEYFYGFLAGEASQYEPTMVRNTTQWSQSIAPEGYHLTEDIATDAIKWLREQKAYAPDKPFFMYWAPGASHGPHQVMKEWADKYKGKFDDGWDKYRERAFARQAKGWIPQNAQLTPRPASMASWDSIPEDEKPSSAA
jgi:arylsulfatase A-like enzyme